MNTEHSEARQMLYWLHNDMGIPMKDIAEATEVSTTTISHIYSGRRKHPMRLTVNAIRAFYQAEVRRAA